MEPTIRHASAEQPIISIRRESSISALPQLLGRCFGELFDWLARNERPAAGHPFVIYHAIDRDHVDAEVCVPVAAPPPGAGHIVGRVLDAGEFATLLHVGSYEDLGVAYGQLTDWIARHGYHVIGPVREVYLNGPSDVASPAEYRTEIQMPVLAEAASGTAA
jgi:effector-binding domain-containing protein